MVSGDNWEKGRWRGVVLVEWVEETVVWWDFTGV